MKTITMLAVAAASFTPIVSAQTERDLDSHEHGAAQLNIAIDDEMIFIELESPWNNLIGFEHKPSTPEQHALLDDAFNALNQPEQLFSFEGSTCVGTDTVIESSLDADEEDHQADDHDGHGEEHEGDHDDDDDAHGEKHNEKHDDDDDAHGEKHTEKHDDDHDAHGEKHTEKHDDDNDAHGEKHTEKHDDDHDAHGEKHDDEHDAHDEKHEGDHNEEHANHEEKTSHSALLVAFTFECDNTSTLSAINVNLLEKWSGFKDLDVQLLGPSGQSMVELNQQLTSIDTTLVQ